MTIFVGLGHVARAGKSTAAHALVRDLNFTCIGFADALKELALEADPIIQGGAKVNVNIGHGRLRHIVHGMGGWDRSKDDFPEVRTFLQNLGLGARKVFGETFWVDRLIERASRFQRVVIPDVRFQNEADAIQAAGGIVIRIDRPGYVARGHVSETELADWEGWDHVIGNSSDVIELERRIVELVRPIVDARAEATYGVVTP